MEPLAAISLAGNVIQFVDFATNIVSRGNELYFSSHGALSKNMEIEDVAKRLIDINQRLLTSPLRVTEFSSTNGGRPRYEPLVLIVESCNEVAKELLETLDKLKVRGNHRRWRSVQQAIRSVWNQDRIDRLVERMAKYREEMVIQVLVLGR